MLFKHNNNNTFVLDNVISSAQEFKKFETNHLKTDQNQTAMEVKDSCWLELLMK